MSKADQVKTNTGSSLANTLDGGSGNDTPNGGLGNDRLTGGSRQIRLYLVPGTTPSSWLQPRVRTW